MNKYKVTTAGRVVRVDAANPYKAALMAVRKFGPLTLEKKGRGFWGADYWHYVTECGAAVIVKAEGNR